MKPWFLLGMFAGLLAAGQLSAQAEPRLTVSLSANTVLLGHYFVATFTLENVDTDQFSAPDFTDFDLVAGPHYSSSIQVVNGRMTQQVSYSYYLRPRNLGRYFLGPAGVPSDAGYLETAPQEILVEPNPAGLPQPDPNPAGRPNALSSPFDGLWPTDFFERMPWPNWEDLLAPPARRDSLPATPQPQRPKTTRI